MTTIVIEKSAKPADRLAISKRQVVVYLLTYAARGFYAPFISLYLLSVGFSPVEVGLLNGVSAFARLIIVPAYSAYVDRLGEHRKLLSIQFLIAGLSTFFLVLLPQKLWMGAMFITRDTVDIPAAALMGQLSITGFKERGSQMYGKLRATGSIGWAAASFASGTLISLGGYVALIVFSAIGYITSVLLTKSFPERTATTNSRLDKPPKRLPAFWLVMSSNLLFYIGMTPMNLFMYAYFKEYLGADDALVGVFAACIGLFEVPWMIGINRIYRYMGTRVALWIGLIGQGVFLVALALMSGLELLLPLFIFRGIFYAMQNISLTLMVTELSHPANVATNQAITWVTVPALALIFMGPIAGWMYEYVSPQLLFSISGLIVILGALFLTIGRGMIEKGRGERLSMHVN